MFPFRKIFMDATETTPHVGDRLVYDEANGTLFVHREGSEVFFQPQDETELSTRLFIGRGWTRELTQASAELYARLGGLSGAVIEIEGSVPTMHVFEIAK